MCIKPRKPKLKKRPKNAPAFDLMVENGIDFLSRSIAEFETSPKYSAIHFAAGVEVILKSRLLAEHWIFVANKMDAAKRGSENTVSASKLVSRLEDVLDENLDDLKAAFLVVTQTRNRLVHRFDEVLSKPFDPKKPSEKSIKLAANQSRCWFSLYSLLKGKWSDRYDKFRRKILELDREMHRKRAFLTEKFRIVGPDLKKAKDDGRRIYRCPACEFDSSVERDSEGLLSDRDCHVCLRMERYLRVDCPIDGCRGVILFEAGDTRLDCPECSHRLIDDEIVEAIPSIETGYGVACCGLCSSFEPRTYCVPGSEDTEIWLCLDCLEIAPQADNCEWCSELCTFLDDDSYITGCHMCDGRMGYDKD